ncbi:MAG: 1-acyl-sn-glycerol-3-phosphate acyltransferase [Melioribacteraceae bacterium]|nr:1-acyl-sn-glycerol-3-phosphate acyltransferase [Melioribacteraceae bacterium]
MYPKEYITKYCDSNNYRTSKNYFCLFPAFNFYLNLLRILIKSNRLARKGIYNDIQWSNSSVDVINSLENSGIKFYFEGIDNVKNVNVPVIFISNHMSTLETMVLPALIQPYKNVVYVIKEELAKYPLFGKIVMARDPIRVGRYNPREDLIKVLEQGAEKIKNGKSIIIFPQKTRTKFFDESSFNTLGIKLAKKNNIPVIPVALYTEAWGNGKLIKEIGKIDKTKEVKISFGNPFYVEGNGNEEHQRVVNFIKQKFVEWKLEDLIV